MRRAFTLIELLVVIAIIAILAAILFPVFAQAKEAAKKTAYISNMKQTGTSAQLYIADTDDTYPQGFVARGETGLWAYGVVHPVPANTIVSPPWDTQVRIDMSSCFFANSMQPYMKNYDLFNEPNAPQVTVAGGPAGTPDLFRAGVKPAQMGVMMNGFFHTLNGSSVGNVGAAILFWNCQKININGRGMSSPALSCPGGAVNAVVPCIFTPSGPATPLGGTTSGYNVIYDFVNTVWQFGKKGIFSRADSSTKALAQGSTLSPALAAFSSKELDPYAGVNGPAGTPAFLYECNTARDSNIEGPPINGNGYWCYFRPDRQ